METLDSGIGSRSPTPDSSSHSQPNSSKVTKVTTQTNHINNNSHNNTNSNGTYTNSKTKGSDKGDASSASTTSTSSNGSGSSSNNHSSSNSSNHGNNTSTTTNTSKTYRDYNNRHSSGHGQYKKYASHQNHYGYGGHMHYQRYNGNGHRNYGNKHFYNTTNYHHNNHHHHHYQGQGYHHQFVQQNHHVQSSNASNNHGSHPNAHHHQHNAHHNNHHSNSSYHSQSQYFTPHSGSSLHHQNRGAPPQVFISSDAVDAIPWSRRGGGDNTNTNWSSPNIDVGDSSSSSVQISLNLSAMKQGFYSPSLQNASPATSPSTTDSSDAYSLQEEGTSTTGSVNIQTAVTNVRHPGVGAFNYPNGSTLECTLSGTGTVPTGSAMGYPYHPYHPSGFYTYPGASNTHPIGNGRAMSHHHLIGPNMGLLMPADPSLSVGKADSSISSSSSDKTLEWSDDGALLTSSGSSDREEFSNSSTGLPERCSTPEFIYSTSNLATHYTTGKKRFYNGTGSTTGKVSPAVNNPRFHFPRKMTYHPHGFPKEWFDDLDPEEYVRAFSKFGELKERPAALTPSVQGPPNDSLSEGIWSKFVANQQTTETFRKKMELWRDVSRILRALNFSQTHFKHDPRNFPTFGLQVVGSTMSGFGSNTSDVDMCLLVRGSDVDQRYEAVDKLQVLHGALSAAHWLDNVELIYAKVPILKFRDPKRHLEVDLNCNNFVGIRNTHMLYCYSQADWRLKPLVLVVKLWAHFHGINDAKNMTISSYSLVLMVIHFLQCGVKEPVLPVLQQTYPEKFSNNTNILFVKINEILPSWHSQNNESIGNLLIQFLEYYAHTFDYSENAVSVRTGGTIPIKQAAAYKSVKNDPHQWKYLCIEEPFDRTNTARSVYDRDTFDKILGIFNVSYQRLLASRNLESIFTLILESDARSAQFYAKINN